MPKVYNEGGKMSKKKVFVSFDYEHDRRYKNLLEAWDANDKFDFEFTDHSSHEINSDNVGRVKAALSARIKDSTYTLVIVGKYANSPHKDRELIGYRNWINFEVARSKDYKNKLVAVKLDKENQSPDELIGAGASWAMSFTEDAIVKALNNA